MKRSTLRLSVALLAFAIGICATLWILSSGQLISTPKHLSPGEPPDLRVVSAINEHQEESPEAKAVRLAETFIRQNGYTDLPGDSSNLSYETIEFADNADEVLRWRHDTLERKAFGVISAGKRGAPGWTIVFRYNQRRKTDDDNLGRAVTMDDQFRDLRVEHKAIFLNGSLIKKL